MALTKSGSGSSRRSPYIYFNILSFLNKASPPTNTQSSIDNEEPDGDDLADPDILANREGPYQTAVVPKKRKPRDEIGQQLIGVLKESAEDRRKRENESQDEDRLFLMSLVSDFKKIPQYKKLATKRQILAVIEENQQCGNSSYQDFESQYGQGNITSSSYRQTTFGNSLPGSQNSCRNQQQLLFPSCSTKTIREHTGTTTKNTPGYSNQQASNSRQPTFHYPMTDVEMSYTDLQPPSRASSTPLSMAESDDFNEDQDSALISCFTNNNIG